jgi:hypothetical protein
MLARLEKRIKLAIKNFTWFYQKWISKNKIKSADGQEFKKDSTFGFSIQPEAKIFQVFGLWLWPNVRIHLRSFTGIHCVLLEHYYSVDFP